MLLSPALLLAALLASPGRVYVSNEDSGDVAVVDPASNTVLARIAVGPRPRGMRLSPDGRRLFVAVSGAPKGHGAGAGERPAPDPRADGIVEVDLATARVVMRHPSANDPETFDLSPDGRVLYLSHEDVARASFYDLLAGRFLASLEVGREPEGVTVRPGGREVWVTSEEDHTVAVIDVRRPRVAAQVPVCKRPRVVVFDAAGAQAYVSCEEGAAVAVVDAKQRLTVAEIALGAGTRPMGLALSRDGRTLYVGNGRHGSVSVVDVAARKAVRTLADVGRRPWGLALSPDGARLYVANGPSHDVSVVDTTSGRVVQRIATGQGPWGVLFGPAVPAVPQAAAAP